MTIQERVDKRASLLADNQALNDVVEARDGIYTADEDKQYKARNEDIVTLTVEIDAEAQKEKRADELKAHGEWAHETRGRQTQPGDLGNGIEEDAAKELRAAAHRSYFANGERGMNADEHRALQADNDTGGGYTIPDDFVATLIQAVDNTTFMRSISTIHSLAYGANLGMPSLDTDMSAATWTPEITSATEDTSLAFGRRELSTNQLAKLVKVSRPLLRSSAINMEALIMERLGYQFGVTAENVYLNGTGASQPLGVFTASDNGISTTYDISSGNTTTAITFNGLKTAKYDLKAQYWAGSSWIFHRDAVESISKIKDGDGQYIWQASVTGGDPDMLLGFPMLLSEYAPNTFTTGLYVGILGDFSFYHIAESLGLTVQRLEELYAATNQVGFIGRQEIDGMPVLGEAFRRVTLA
jgi:HK97 family phage major capsid protein